MTLAVRTALALAGSLPTALSKILSRWRYLSDSARQNRLEVRRLFFARHDADLDFFETGFFQPAVQIALRETEPAIAVQLARFVEAVLKQVQNHDLPAHTKNLVRRTDRL